MIEFNVLTLFPEMITKAGDFSILKRAKDANLIKINVINPRDFTQNKHKKHKVTKPKTELKCCVKKFTNSKTI